MLCLSIALAGVAEDDSEVALQPHAVHLSTALDHITVLEFGEPVTQAAAGSSAFNIEWRENKVLIRPLRSGASSNLFVWTASKKRYAYELDPPGDAKDMNYAIDNPTPVQPPRSSRRFRSASNRGSGYGAHPRLFERRPHREP